MVRARIAVGTVVVLCAAALAGCGNSSPTSNDSANSGGSHTVTVTVPSTSAETSTTTTAASTSTGPSIPACVAADLTPEFLGGNGAAGTNIVGFALKNTSSSACSTGAWPGVEFLNSDGKPVAKPATRVTHDMVGTVKPTALTVEPGDEVSFRIAIIDAENGGAGCVNAAYLQIYAPNDTTAMKVPVTVTACPDMTVTPLQSGTSAFTGQ